jgi:hypothetical protein
MVTVCLCAYAPGYEGGMKSKNPYILELYSKWTQEDNNEQGS